MSLKKLQDSHAFWLISGEFSGCGWRVRIGNRASTPTESVGTCSWSRQDNLVSQGECELDMLGTIFSADTLNREAVRSAAALVRGKKLESWSRELGAISGGGATRKDVSSRWFAGEGDSGQA